jgi:hypothetical protein
MRFVAARLVLRTWRRMSRVAYLATRTTRAVAKHDVEERPPQLVACRDVTARPPETRKGGL